MMMVLGSVWLVTALIIAVAMARLIELERGP